MIFEIFVPNIGMIWMIIELFVIIIIFLVLFGIIVYIYM